MLYTTQEVETFIVEDNELFILPNQYHGCCWPGDARIQTIDSHNKVLSQYLGLIIGRVNSLRHEYNICRVTKHKFQLHYTITITFHMKTFKYVPIFPGMDILALIRVVAWHRLCNNH